MAVNRKFKLNLWSVYRCDDLETIEKMQMLGHLNWVSNVYFENNYFFIYFTEE